MEKTEFESIARQIRQRAITVARAYTLDANQAEDVAQDVMLKLWTLREELTTANHIERMATVMARNIAIDSYRSNHTVPLETTLNIKDDRQAKPDIALEEKDNALWLTKKLQSLPSKEYQVLQLRQVEHKSNEDIANIMGIEKASVATTLSRARKKMLCQIMKWIE